MDYVATLRHGDMHFTARFSARFSGLNMGDKCIIRTDRGVEVGQIVSRVVPLDPKEEPKPSGDILRKMTSQDIEKERQIETELEPAQLQFCQQKIRERNLEMKLCHVEHLFGDTKTIFYFLAQGRVDFRALVKDLALEYHQRIEMRQIGVRDEARMLAYFEHCGRELCCRTFINRLEPVTMKMAKNQKATLDPNKISGRCGRLMCCLRFEDATYEELRKLLPRKGARVMTDEGVGRVISSEVLSQLVRVKLEDGRDTVAPVESLGDPDQPPKPKPPKGKPVEKAGADEPIEATPPAEQPEADQPADTQPTTEDAPAADGAKTEAAEKPEGDAPRKPRRRRRGGRGRRRGRGGQPNSGGSAPS